MGTLENYLKDNKKPEHLYHYTSTEGFLGIAQNNKMWASHILFMNDRSEFSYAFEMSRDIIRKLEQGKKLSYKPNLELQRSFAFLLDGNIEKEDVYIIPLSEKQDDLNMWKKYTDMSPGLCLELDTGKLGNTISQNNISIGRVIYNADEQRGFLKSIILEDVEKAHDKSSYSNILYNLLLNAAPLIKHPAFKDEKEWRIIIRVSRQEIDFRLKDSIIIPYYKHGIDKTNTISSITIGPGGNSEYVKQSIEFFCSRYCQNIHDNAIKQSGLPYRQ